MILAAIFVACSSKPEYTFSKKDIKIMKERYIFNQNGNKVYMPLIYGLKNYVFRIFSVPGNNRVGTIEFDNGFTLIEFKDEELDYDLIAKDYYDEVYGAFTYSFAPVYSDEEILYSQNSWLFKINLHKGNVKVFELFNKVVDATDEHCHRLAYSKHGFLCEIQTGYFEADLKKIKVVELSDTLSVNGELHAGVETISYNQPWQCFNNTIITYDSSANKLICHTTELKETTHPFTEIFNRNSSKFRKLKEFIIHPTLPFGFVVEIGKDWDSEKINAMPTEVYDTSIIPLIKERDRHSLILLRWDTPDTSKQFVPVFTEPVSLIPGLHPKTYSDFQWSPDGKWVVFRDETQYNEWNYGTPTSQESPVFIALPVSGKNPMYFGEPLYLGKVMRENAQPESSAWIQEPVSFVVSDGLVLYKWELDELRAVKTINTPNDVIKIK